MSTRKVSKASNSPPDLKEHSPKMNGKGRKRLNSEISDGLEYSKKIRQFQAKLAAEQEKINAAMGPLAEADKIDYDDENLVIPDPDCDPEHPRTVTFSDISTAMFNIKVGITHTPCTKSLQLSSLYGMDLYFKKEYLQVTGSFKERGARYALSHLTDQERQRGVIAASAGNHALALSYHGKSLGIPVTVVMPVFAPIMKISLCRGYGATVILKGNNISKAKDYAMRLGKEKGLKYVNGYDAPDILAGQGTIGLEILEQVPDVDAVLVPVGGGGLIAGVAVAVKTLKKHCQIIGVESETCASFTAALKKGHPIGVELSSTLADGLAVPTVGGNSFQTAKPIIDEVVTVHEESIALAILRLIEMEKAVVEGAGAVGLAAIISNKLPQLKGKKVVCILTGGNIDTTVLGRSIERGLAVDGRLIRLEVVVSDRPGGIAELATHLAHSGASIKDIFHERAWISTDVFSVKVKIICETRDRSHVQELEALLREKYKHVAIS
ncbi:unnamed protein product, partial [Mesorhabditis belari]|uniref:L-serine deaminase n=1 Tax=Mesorhabditis belari TaxID=2138241 RepID=A0AAF3J2R1_9BILA